MPPHSAQREDMAPQLLAVPQVAARLAVAPRTVRDWLAEYRRSGGLRGLRAISLSSRCIRISEADLVAWIDSRTRSPTP
jgi:predicted DNA-binding transcriptional regulator AlpA